MLFRSTGSKIAQRLGLLRLARRAAGEQTHSQALAKPMAGPPAKRGKNSHAFILSVPLPQTVWFQRAQALESRPADLNPTTRHHGGRPD